MILSFVTIMVKGAAQLMTHSKHMNVITEPIAGDSDHMAMARSYGVLKPGVGKVDVCLWNHSSKQITLLKWAAVGETAATNAILAFWVPKPTENEIEATAKKKHGRAKRTFRQKWLDGIMGLEFGRSKTGTGLHTGICLYICCAWYGPWSNVPSEA